MTTSRPLQIWELAGTAFFCGVSVVTAALLPGMWGQMVTAIVWAIGFLLLSVGGVFLIQRSSLPAVFCGALMAILVPLASATLLSRLFFEPVVLLSVTQGAVVFSLVVRQLVGRRRPAIPTRVAIRVTSDAPTHMTADSKESSGKCDPSEVVREEINHDLDQALLSRLSTGTESVVEEPESGSLKFASTENHIIQRYERGLDPDGREWLEGTIRVDFLRAQKTSIVHIPFWPAFKLRPEVNSELLDGPHLKIEVKAVERWGIRIELTRRAAGLDPDSAELAFFVTSQSSARGAA